MISVLHSGENSLVILTCTTQKKAQLPLAEDREQKTGRETWFPRSFGGRAEFLYRTSLNVQKYPH